MRYFFVAIVFCVANFSYAAESESDESVAILTKVLNSDLAGDPSGRIERVAFHRHNLLEASQPVSGVRPEVYFLDSDPLAIASSWEMSGKPKCISVTKCVVTIHFRTLAVSHGFGVPSWDNKVGRELELFPTPSIEEVTFQLQNIHHKWKIVDPPIPHVTPSAMASFLEDEYQQYSSTEMLLALQKAGGHAEENNSLIKAWITRQLNMLALLRHSE